jgi:putative two-component system response regulator
MTGISQSCTNGKMNGKVTVAVIDDNPEIRGVVATLLSRDGYVVFTADDGAAGLELVWREQPDVIISDVSMPNVDGFELCRTLKTDRATRLTPLILLTGNTEREYRLKGIEAGADDFLTKPVDAAELRARVRSLARLKQYTDDLDTAESVILSLGATVEARDGSTSGHCERMAAYAAAFGTHLGLSHEEVAALHRGGYLHDVGKVGVPDAVLLKPGRLTSDEFAVMKRHTVVGEAVCGDFRALRLVKPIIRHHHERLDGSGYPDGLCGDRIPLLAQIVGIVDVYDALTTDRPYRESVSAETALAQLQRETERGWRSTRLVESFISLSRSGRLAGFGARMRSFGRL